MEPPPPGTFTSGRSGLAADVLKGEGPELGTVCGMQVPVNVSGSSPPGQPCATDAVGATGTANMATAGAAATATAKPPARISRRAESWKVAIVTLSVGKPCRRHGCYGSCRVSAQLR